MAEYLAEDRRKGKFKQIYFSVFFATNSLLIAKISEFSISLLELLSESRVSRLRVCCERKSIPLAENQGEKK